MLDFLPSSSSGLAQSHHSPHCKAESLPWAEMALRTNGTGLGRAGRPVDACPFQSSTGSLGNRKTSVPQAEPLQHAWLTSANRGYQSLMHALAFVQIRSLP
jgi:hypothetical protein